MLVFGHVGLTLGAAAVVAGAVNRQEKTSWFVSLSKRVDIRLLAVGSLLPDIIDKPVGQYLFVETFHNGRIFSHSLLFLMLLSAFGFYLFKAYRQVWMLTLAAGTLTHLIFDGMWAIPGTFLWPLMGWKFSPIELEGLAGKILDGLVSNPMIFTSEIIGLAVVFWLCVTVIRRKQMGVLIRNGRIF